MKRALVLAGAIDAHDRWTGGKLTVVQTGDEIDRGDDDRAIVDFVESLEHEAAGAGGEVIALLGNHEIMNASLDFRYVTSGGFAAFSEFAGVAPPSLVERLPREAGSGRGVAFSPGGPYAQILALRPVVALVGDTVFVHGGVLPKHVAYGLDRMNEEVDEVALIVGKRREPPAVGDPPRTVPYGRVSTPAKRGEPDCADLADALRPLGAKKDGRRTPECSTKG